MKGPVNILYASCIIALWAQIYLCDSKIAEEKITQKGKRIWKLSQITKALPMKQNTQNYGVSSGLDHFSVPLKHRDDPLRRRLRLPLIPKGTETRKNHVDMKDPLTRRYKKQDFSRKRAFRFPSISRGTYTRKNNFQEEKDDKKSSGLRMHGFMSIYQNRRRRRFNRNQGLIYG